MRGNFETNAAITPRDRGAPGDTTDALLARIKRQLISVRNDHLNTLVGGQLTQILNELSLYEELLNEPAAA